MEPSPAHHRQHTPWFLRSNVVRGLQSFLAGNRFEVLGDDLLTARESAAATHDTKAKRTFYLFLSFSIAPKTCELDLPPKMRQPVKRQNPWNGENESWDCLAGGLLGRSSWPRSSGWSKASPSQR